jgi:16S rRNA C967 or C1407 C5-methylase (RsmB/RsmF family)
MSQTKKKKKKKSKGLDEFESFYSEAYGEHWQDLKTALLAPKNHVLLINPCTKFQGDSEILKHPFAGQKHLYETQFLKGPLEQPSAKEGELMPYYFLDGASAFAPIALQVEKGDDVLDLCAAPGGKSLLLAFGLLEAGNLTANDKSENRRFRLKRVLESYLPESFCKGQLRITGFDAGGWCLYEKEAYDKILLDAPCSSERHLLESPHHLNDWRPGRTKRLAANQWTMLASAWLVLKPGGRLVYSTCSISPLENDGVVKKLIKKFGDECEVIFPNIEGGEKSEFGTTLLPDHSGHGPFYLSVINKKA